MGNLAERLKTVNKNRPIVLVDELASTGELMIRLSREVLKHLEKDADITLATLLLLDAVSDLYGVKHGGTMAPSQNKLHTHMDTFVPRVSFERLQQSLEAKATQLGFKKPSGLMKVGSG
jgi:hypothetical protein